MRRLLGKPAVKTNRASAETNEQFVRRVFAILLSREPDPLALTTYTQALSDGMRREDLALHVACSDEYRVRSAPPPFPIRVTEHNYGDVALSACVADEVGFAWYDHDYPEFGELAFLAHHSLKPGAVVYDIGAHQGIYALAIAGYVQPSGCVIAVEANPFNAGLIDVNRRMNHIACVTPVAAAAAERSGEISFGGGSNGHVELSPHATALNVKALTVDSLTASHPAPDLVIVDVEGYEARVLDGAAATLQSDADWHIEVHAGCGLEDFGGSVERLLSFFPRDRFDLFLSDEMVRQPRPLTEGRLDELRSDRFYLTAVSRSAAS